VAPDAKPELAIWPWVLPLGSRNRRRYGGLQFCPPCLAEDTTPYFRRSWRLAWHVGCVRHGTLLTDHCGCCRAPVEPHRTLAGDVTLCRCPSCGHDLRESSTASVCSDALAFQEVADQVLVSGHGTWSASVVACDTWFGLAAKHASGQILGRGEDAPLPGLTALPLNLQRPSERVLRLRMAFRGMNGEPRGEPLLARHGMAKPDRVVRHNGKPQSGTSHRPAPARPQTRVQGEWVRLLRRLRVGCP